MKSLYIVALLLFASVGCRYNGNTNITVTQPGASEKGLAPIPGTQQAASGAVNVIIYGNTATQDATKTLDGIKAAASAAQSQGGDATGGAATVTTPTPATPE